MGSNHFYPEERPVHRARVDGFWMDELPVTVDEFRRFIEGTGYVTVAERVPLYDVRQWWCYLPGACWHHPDGPASTIAGRELRAATHVAYEDALSYARWAHKELPTEAEWERAARGGLEGATFVWGNEFAPGGRTMANTWRGEFPWENLATDGYARWSILVTFAATLLLSVRVAVGVGVAVGIVLALRSAASNVKVYEVIELEDGRFAQADPPAQLPSNTVSVLEVVGSLFFAGARTLEEALPSPVSATRPAVVLRLRGRTNAGATLIEVLDNYADDLAEVGGRWYLSGVDERLAARFRLAGKLDLDHAVHLVPTLNVYGESTTHAIQNARAWLGTGASDQ